MYKFADVRTDGTVTDEIAAGKRQTLWGQNFGAGISFVGAVDEVTD